MKWLRENYDFALLIVILSIATLVPFLGQLLS